MNNTIEMNGMLWVVGRECWRAAIPLPLDNTPNTFFSNRHFLLRKPLVHYMRSVEWNLSLSNSTYCHRTTMLKLGLGSRPENAQNGTYGLNTRGLLECM